MAGWSVTAEVQKFDEAHDHFASRVLLSDEERKQIPLSARSRAFWIAGVAQMDVVQHVHDAQAKAIAEGTTLEDFKKQVRADLTKAWGKDDPARIETIFRNATQTAYNAGRWHQMSAPSVVRFRPFWLYDAVLDERTSKVCTVCNGTLLAADDPWWDTHWPPAHHRCRSSVRSLRRTEAERRGITQTAPTTGAQGGFGFSPRLATDWKPDPTGRDARLMQELERKRADLAARPQVPALPKTFGPPVRKIQPLQPLREKLRISPFQELPLTPEQQKARQTAEHLNKGYAARSKATQEERRTWLLWEWVRGANRKTSSLVKHAALREFGLTSAPWAKGKAFSHQAADLTRTQRDLRELHGETQAWFKRRGIRTVTLFRGVHGDVGDDVRNTVESWTSDKTVAERFARQGPNGRVLRVTVPVTQVLVHHQGPGWLDGPFGAQAEYLLMY